MTVLLNPEQLWKDALHPDDAITLLWESGNEIRASERKRRLFAVACCRNIFHLMVDERCQAAVDAAERFADGFTDRSNLQAKRRAVVRSLAGNWLDSPAIVAAVGVSRIRFMESLVARLCRDAVRLFEGTYTQRFEDWKVDDAETRCQVFFFLDIFGNPFRPAAVDPAWREWNGGTVVKLARTIYDERRWELMPLLGDALEDALCHNQDLIDHCRGPGPHARGCWVVDLILGKE